MAMRVCGERDCPVLVPKGARDGRCDVHRRAKDKARGTRQQRGYDSVYDAMRRADVARLAQGQVLHCWRCHDVVLPHDYSLGHCDDDRSITHGPEHLARCNLANTRGGCTHSSHT